MDQIWDCDCITKKGLAIIMTKRILSLTLALILLFSIAPTASAADWNNGQNGFWDTVNYGSDWKLWRQTAAPAKSNMNLYGCWVVSMSKLLMEAGAAPSGFNPGVFLKWEKQNGYINSNFNQSNKGGSGYAPVAYAKTQGVSLSVVSSGTKTQAQLLTLLKTNYLIVKVLTGSSGAHYAYVAREESLRDGKIYYRDSWGSKKLTPFDQKINGRTYGVHQVWAYPVPASSGTATGVELASLPGGEVTLRNGSLYLNAAKDSNGGNVNTSSQSGNAAQKWQLVKSGNTYSLVSKNSPSGRVLNVYSDSVSAAGKNITLYKNVGDANQLWVFEKKGDAYIVHPSDNLAVALTLQGDGDVKLAKSSGAASQLWYIEDVQKQGVAPADPQVPEEESAELTDEIMEELEQAPEEVPVNIDDGEKNHISLSATVTSVGVKLDWTPNGNALGYRIYRSAYPNNAGISITDFPITDKEYVDANVEEYTTYYYTIREVLSEAKFDEATMELTSELCGDPSEKLTIETGELIVDEMKTKHFILMQLGKESMRVDEETLEIDPGRGTAPVAVSGRTLVPIRAIIETMGGTVDWIESENKIVLVANDHTVEMWIGAREITVDGVAMTMDVVPEVINYRTMLPVRFVAENIGCQIEWIGSTQQIIIVFYL